MTLHDLHIPDKAIRDFCAKWKIADFALFGSVLRKDFRPDSDVDVLVAFDDSARWSLFDLAAMRDELTSIFDRDVDLVLRSAVESSPNPYRRKEILGNARTLYAA